MSSFTLGQFFCSPVKLYFFSISTSMRNTALCSQKNISMHFLESRSTSSTVHRNRAVISLFLYFYTRGTVFFFCFSQHFMSGLAFHVLLLIRESQLLKILCCAPTLSEIYGQEQMDGPKVLNLYGIPRRRRLA